MEQSPAMPRKPKSEVSPTRYFWVWTAVLGAGLGLLVLAHTIIRRFDVSGGTIAMLGVIATVTVSLAIVGRSVQVIVSSAFSDAHRVFRARHLLFCGALLLAAGSAVAYAVVVQNPFGKLFAHGRITGEDVTDVGIVIAALVCMVGAGVALSGSWEASHAERNWHHTLHLHSRRRT